MEEKVKSDEQDHSHQSETNVRKQVKTTKSGILRDEEKKTKKACFEILHKM